MNDADPRDQPSNPPPPGRPPFAPPPGTPFYGSPHDASWEPPPGTAFAAGPDDRTAKSRGRRAWPVLARPVPANRQTASPDEADKDQGGRSVPVLLAAAAIVAAIVTAHASLISSEATEHWQNSVADEQRRGAMLLEGVRYTYGSEGDMAFMIVSAEVQAEELRRIGAERSPEVAARVDAEARLQQDVADLVRPSSEVASDARYRLESGGVDLQLRLADSRTEDAAGDMGDPPGELAAGDTAADHATRLMLATIAVGVAFLFGALAQAFAERRRLLLVLGWAALAVGAVAALAVELGARGVTS